MKHFLSLLVFIGMTSLQIQAGNHRLRTPQLIKYHASATPDSILTLRDSIVARQDGQTQWKTTYTYNQFGYVTSRLTHKTDGSYDTQNGYYQEFDFDAQNRCTRRARFACQANGTKGEETECVVAMYNEDGYAYREVEYDFDRNGQRIIRVDNRFDQWMNPVYCEEYDNREGEHRLETLLKQEFTGRAFVIKEGNYDDPHMLRERCNYSIEYSRSGDGFRVYAMRREQVTEGIYVRTTYYEINDEPVSLNADLTSLWQPDRQYEWHLNDACTRPLSLRTRDYEYYNGEKHWIYRDDQSVDFKWDDQDRLLQTFVNPSKNGWYSHTTYNYANDNAPYVPLERILKVEDSDSWDDGGMDDYGGDLIYGWFGRLASMHYENHSDDYWYVDDVQDITFDEWDANGRFTHGTCPYTWKADEAYGRNNDTTRDLDIWLTWTDDGRYTSLIVEEYDDNDPNIKYYEKTVVNYDRWNLMCDYTTYRSDSPDGPWQEVSYYEEEPVNPPVDPIKKAMQRSHDEYRDGDWEVWSDIETDEEGNTIDGHMTKAWNPTYRARHFTIDTYEDPRGALEAIGYDEAYPDYPVYSLRLEYDWNPETGQWELSYQEGPYGQLSKGYTDEQGRWVNEYYNWDSATLQLSFDRCDLYTLDDEGRVIKLEDNSGTTTLYTYLPNTQFLLTLTRGNYTETYYYADRGWWDPERLDIRNTEFTPASDHWTDLQGRRFNTAPTLPGHYIRGGKIIIIK